MASPVREYAWLRAAVFALSLLAWFTLLRPVLVASPAADTDKYAPMAYCGRPSVLSEELAALSRAQQPLAYAPTPPLQAVLSWAWAGDWVVMLAAMMLPTLVPPLTYIHQRSFARRRAWAMTLFLVSYGAVWMGAGGILLLLQWLAQQTSAPFYYLPVAGAGLLALVWQVSPLKQRCLNRGHRHRPLAAFGVRADWDVLRLGAEHGGWCTASCWLLMLVPLLLPHGHLWVMAGVGLLMFCERLDPPDQPAWRWRGFKTTTGYGRLYLVRFQRTLVHF